MRSPDVTQWRTRTEKRTKDFLFVRIRNGVWGRRGERTVGVAAQEADPTGLALEHHQHGQVADAGRQGGAAADEGAEGHGVQRAVLAVLVRVQLAQRHDEQDRHVHVDDDVEGDERHHRTLLHADDARAGFVDVGDAPEVPVSCWLCGGKSSSAYQTKLRMTTMV